MRFNIIYLWLLIDILSSCGMNDHQGNSENDTKNETMTHQQTTSNTQFRGLYFRDDNNQIIEASEEENNLVKNYLEDNLLEKGERVRILSSSTKVKKGDTVRVIHLYQNGKNGKDLFINGPKEVIDEFVDGKLASPESNVKDYPWIPVYDGITLTSPGSDYGFNITSYTFETLGVHTIIWKPGGSLVSNELLIMVE